MDEKLLYLTWYEMRVMPWVIVNMQFESSKYITLQSLN